MQEWGRVYAAWVNGSAFWRLRVHFNDVIGSTKPKTRAGIGVVPFANSRKKQRANRVF